MTVESNSLSPVRVRSKRQSVSKGKEDRWADGGSVRYIKGVYRNVTEEEGLV